MSICICPVCCFPLMKRENGYFCEKGHHFDRARSGYTNLLVGKAGGQHGDNLEMIRARRDFLNGGYYAPLKEALCRVVDNYFPQGGTLLDAGCGECYYTQGAMEIVSSRGGCGVGIDISKEALRVGGVRPAVKSGTLTLFAAGVYHMPIGDTSVDMVLNFFAPLVREEYVRVLKPQGVLVMAIPAARHLWEMKEVLYDTPKENQVEDFALPGFTLLEEREVTSSFILEGQEKIHALFSMTPYYFRTPKEGRARLAALDTLAVTGRFHLLVYRKEGETLDRTSFLG